MRMEISRRFFMTQLAGSAFYARRSFALAKREIPFDNNRLVLFSDPHITPSEKRPDIPAALARCVSETLALIPRPQQVIVFGDLAFSNGLPEEYQLFKELMRPLEEAGIQWRAMLGNHDRRNSFLECFPEYARLSPVPDRLVSIVNTPHLDFILLDSCKAANDVIGVPGPVEGELDDAQRLWLREQLANYRKPVIVGAHHPSDQLMIDNLLSAAPGVVGYLAGHAHRWQVKAPDPLRPQLTLPATGPWGDLGYTVVDINPERIAFLLKQFDFKKSGSTRLAQVLEAGRVARNNGRRATMALSIDEKSSFKPMFNGRDLQGWVPCNIAPESFSVREDGLVMTTGQPIGTLRTERMYENFVVEFEWRHLTAGGNSGLFVWADGLPSVGSAFSRGIEVQVLDPGYQRKGQNEWYSTHGDLFPVNGADLTLAGRISPSGKRSFPMEERTRPTPQWNHYRIVGIDGNLSLSVNGKEVTIARQASPRKGYLMLESEGGECHFRNLRIRELPTTNPIPEHVAVAADGFLPIFTGLDLRGWQAGADGWSVVKDMMEAVGNGSTIWSNESYSAFELVADLKCSQLLPETPQGVLLQDSTGRITKVASAPLEANAWSRQHVAVTAADRTYGQGPWRIGLSAQGGKVNWRNIFLRLSKLR